MFNRFLSLPATDSLSDSPAQGILNRQTWLSSLPLCSTAPNRRQTASCLHCTTQAVLWRAARFSTSLTLPVQSRGLCSLFVDWKPLAKWVSKVQTLTQGNFTPSLRAASQNKQFAGICIWFELEESRAWRLSAESETNKTWAPQPRLLLRNYNYLKPVFLL